MRLSRFVMLSLAVASLSGLVLAQDVKVSTSDVTKVRVFPNPWRSDTHAGNIVIDHLPAGSSVKLFTVSGHWIRTLSADSSTGSTEWDLMNSHGDKVASGVYLYLVTVPGSGEKAEGKIVVIR